MIYKSISELSAQLKSNQVSAIDLTKQHLNQIDNLNDKLNAIVIDTRDAAISDAKRLDKHLSDDKPLGRLHGIPITIKESFDVTGLKTTVNFPLAKNNVAKKNSILVDRLKSEGAIILGKTNVPLMLSDAQTFGPLYPTCNNPYDVTRSPGGSTGGGAAALASGMSNLEIGSDIGGSIRNPAHFCGLFGLKPTENNHPQDGHVPPMPNKDLGYQLLASTGPLARTVDDLKLAYEVCYKPRWDYLQYLPVNTPTPTHESLKGYRIGWFDQLDSFSCDQATKDAMQRFLRDIEQQGAIVEKISLPREWCVNIYRSWATLYGLVAGQDMNWFMRQLLKLKFRKDIKGSLLQVNKALNQGLNLDFMAYTRALRVRQECIAEFSENFNHYDFIFSPTACGPAIKHNHNHDPILVDDQMIHYTDYCFSFVIPCNAMGNPSLVIPIQAAKHKLPIGLQCISRHYSEPQLFHFAKLLENAGYKFRQPELS